MPSRDLLFLSHCVPYPPDKGERIRAYHEIRRLSQTYRIHLFCFDRDGVAEQARDFFKEYCATAYVEPMAPRTALLKSMVRFLAGDCLNRRYYGSATVARQAERIASEVKPAAAVAYSAVMAQHVPPGVPYLLDMLDVDSEKWLSYAQRRWPSAAYGVEAVRLRRFEVEVARRAVLTLFTTATEEALFRGFAPAGIPTAFMENGVDFEYFDPEATCTSALAGRRYAVFVGSMNYYPNVDAVAHFVEDVLPLLRRRDPAFQFIIVGRNPGRDVLRWSGVPGVEITGGVPDVRPYLRWAAYMAVPFRIARGIQNKVLEALAMGKPVLASDAICRTFGQEVPHGVRRCASPADYDRETATLSAAGPIFDASIRQAARARFEWESVTGVLMRALQCAAL